jgi:folate-dependent phosphoribosylglycinamide formyltransferase PurN
MKGLKRALGRAWDARAWRPEHARLLWLQIAHRSRNRDAGVTEADHLRAAAAWLARAQDVMSDGGVAGRYRLAGGWTSSYPETTGYLIPTFLALASELDDARFEERAQRCAHFLVRLQLPDGAFPGGEVHENVTQPSVFNSGQIMSGLLAWHQASKDRSMLDTARRAADWLVAVQDADGAWRRHVYGGVAATYSAHASCWLAELGVYTGTTRYLEAAERHLEWVLTHYDGATGWFDLAGFTSEDHRARRAVLHTAAYTLWGVLRTSELVDHRDGVAAVERAALAAARRLELSGRLPGVVDHQWRSCDSYECPTGNAQMALVWLRLYRRSADPVLLNAALKAIDLVKRTQLMASNHPDLRGAIPGSDPVWGAYIANALPNWAAKFFVDALLEKRRVLGQLSSRPRERREVPGDVPRTLPELPRRDVRPLRVVLYSARDSHKVPEMVSQWSRWGFRPAAVVLEQAQDASPVDRVVSKIRDSGLRGLVASRLGRTPRRRTRQAESSPPGIDPVVFCVAHQIPYYEVRALDSSEGRALVASLRPDLAVHAGAGILRASVLEIPRLGTLNAHMGVLPYYRGMNVAEWARFNGDPVGCSVHLVDGGIDTGPIVCVRIVDTRTATSIQELRRVVNEAQIALLGEVIQFVVRSGVAPPSRSQRAEEGVQFFRLHPDIAARLEAELQIAALPRQGVVGHRERVGGLRHERQL